jgi:hypothetical protein
MMVNGKLDEKMVVECGKEQTDSPILENGKMVKFKVLEYMS